MDLLTGPNKREKLSQNNSKYKKISQMSILKIQSEYLDVAAGYLCYQIDIIHFVTCITLYSLLRLEGSQSYENFLSLGVIADIFRLFFLHQAPNVREL